MCYYNYFFKITQYNIDAHNARAVTSTKARMQTLGYWLFWLLL
jgi:hypothetical protein